jgi:hypothetical protein
MIIYLVADKYEAVEMTASSEDMNDLIDIALKYQSNLYHIKTEYSHDQFGVLIQKYNDSKSIKKTMYNYLAELMCEISCVFEYKKLYEYDNSYFQRLVKLNILSEKILGIIISKKEFQSLSW